MLICAAGDIHGAMDRLYQDILAFEASLSIRFDYVRHVRDFGVWPDPSRIDKATRHHDGAGDFPVWLEANRRAPRPTWWLSTWSRGRALADGHCSGNLADDEDSTWQIRL